MTLVDRLKTYMDFLKLSVSQFADGAQIPRPTLSQILSGRNKKISNEILTKLHDAYPLLNISWLLFGDGTMQIDGVVAPTISSNSLFSPEDSKNSHLSSNDSLNEGREENKASDQQPISFSPDFSKRVTSIMVFYSDNSFETFIPSQR